LKQKITIMSRSHYAVTRYYDLIYFENSLSFASKRE